MAAIILRNGRVVDPYTGKDTVRDIGICGSTLVLPQEIESDPQLHTFDLSGMIVAPGLIDIHVHLREPGFAYKETIATGTAAAAAGGFTTIVAMPNTNPAIDTIARVTDLQHRIDESALIATHITACITRDRAGEELTDIARLKQQTKIVALSDDGDCVQDYGLMKAAARLARENDLPIMDHCEDHFLSKNGVMRAGPISQSMRLPGMPGETESNIVARNIQLSRETGAHFHQQHLSYKESVRLLRCARQEGLPVSGEASPHHLTLTHDLVPILGTNAKMNPPLGTEEDRQALIAAVLDGTIDIIATDHAPHASWEKARDWGAAPFGILGLETALPLVLTELYGKHHMDLMALLSRFTLGPANLLHLPKDGLIPGAPANLVIFDLTQSFPLDITNSRSRSRNSPFHHKQVIGKIMGTMSNGRWVYQHQDFSS